MTPISFEQARHIAATFTGEPIARYGWQNADVYVVVIDYTDRDLPLGEPDLLVEKATGRLREVTGTMGRPPAPGLQPIGNPPA